MRGFNFVPIRSDPMLIFLSGNDTRLHAGKCFLLLTDSVLLLCVSAIVRLEGT